MASAIARALRVLVPLNAMCSSMWLMPCSASVSLREPALTQMPSEALSRCGMSSVMTVMPLSRVVDRTLTSTPPGPGSRANKGFDYALVVGQDVEAFGPLIKVRQPCRQGRFNTRGCLHGGWKFGGVRGGQDHHRRVAQRQRTGDGDTHGCVRVEQV